MFSKSFLIHFKKPIIFVTGAGLLGCSTTELLLDSEKFHKAGVINRYGFNNDGVGRVQQRVKTARAKWKSYFAILGVNIGENKKNDNTNSNFEISVNYFAAYSDYMVLNLFSPHTTGFLFKKSELQSLLLYTRQAINAMHLDSPPKLFLKIPPDLTDAEKRDIAQVAMDLKYGIDGLGISNTTISRPETLKTKNKLQYGGLSGTPLRQISTGCIREMYNSYSLVAMYP